MNGYSGDAYVGDNDSGSEILFRNVYVDKEGTYEFRTHYTSMFIRSIAVQTGFMPGGDRYDGDDRRLEPPSGRYDAFVYLSR